MVHYHGYELTEKQKDLCDMVMAAFWNWTLDKVLDISGNLEGTYEHETGKSCVLWAGSDEYSDTAWYDSLPRVEGYQTNGYTDEFKDWAAAIIAATVAEKGLPTRHDIAGCIKARCPVSVG